jgi:hypothetical protein
MSYLILRGSWCNVVVLNVHAPCEDKGDDVNGSFYEELGCVFDQLPRYGMNILLGDINGKLASEDIFKPTIGNKSLREIYIGNGVRGVNSATYRNLVVRSTMFLIATFINTPGPLLRERGTIRLNTF